MADLVLRALEQLWQALRPLGLPMAVMGGLAVSFWKHIRATQDVDLLIAVSGSEEEALVRTLEAAGFRAKRQPPVMPLGRFRLLQLLYEPPGSHVEVQVDLLLVTDDYATHALDRRISAQLEASTEPVDVLACEDVILHKLLAARIIDRADVIMLLRANRPSLDLSYLRKSAADLGALADLVVAWSEAFPGDPFPDDASEV